jgi:hypothetical protein
MIVSAFYSSHPMFRGRASFLPVVIPPVPIPAQGLGRNPDLANLIHSCACAILPIKHDPLLNNLPLNGRGHFALVKLVFLAD